MARGTVKAQIANYKELRKTIKSIESAPENVIKYTVSDLRKRAPGIVASHVVERYNLNRNEIRPGAVKKGKDGIKRKVKQAASIKATGETIDTFALVYDGRLLTHTHFGMKPTAPRAGGYTITAEVIKGQRKTLGKVKKLTKKQRKALGKNFTRSGARTSERSPIMLLPTGNKQAAGTNFIPFQRVGYDRKDLRVIKTLSVPQMVDNPQVNAAIMDSLNKLAVTRIENHSKRFFK